MASELVIQESAAPFALPLHPAGEVEQRSQHAFAYNLGLGEQQLSPSTTSSIVLLKERIYDELIRSTGEQEFLPANFIDLFTARERVIEVLNEEGVEYDDDLLAYASGEGKRVFLTLVDIEKLEALQSLYEEGFNDSHLPVGETKTDRKRVGRKKIMYEIRSLDEASNTLRADRWDSFAQDMWNNQSLKSFINTQWLFLAPVFTKDKFRYVFHQKRPLPYIDDGGAASKAGFFSRVTQVRIHDAHQQVLGDGNKPLVALKQLQPDKDTYFQREADTLNVIRELNNKHLIKPIATYRRGESLCFMFPWAHGGNLREFWAKADEDSAPRIKRDADLVLWALEQMYGLANGLEALHEKNCRHGDLKPENLLRFTEQGGRGIIQIADVGLAKFHIVATQNRHARTTTMTGTFRYEPPECDEKSDNPRSRAYDIWSLGCIYLEFLIWLLDGQEGLESFNAPGKFRHFWDLKNGSYQLHAIVEERINAMSQRLGSEDPKIDGALKDVLHIVKTRLLEVKLRSDDDPKVVGRATAEELGSLLATVLKKARQDSKYSFDGSLWRRRPQAASAAPSLEVPQRTDRPKHIVPNLTLAPPPLASEANENVIVVAAPDESPVASNANTAKAASGPARPAEELEPPPLIEHIELTQTQPQLQNLNDDWESTSDNSFAKALFGKMDWSTVRPDIPSAELCGECKTMDIWSNGLKRIFQIGKLKESANDCDLCRLFYQVALEKGVDEQGGIQFHRIASAFKKGPEGLPVLSIYADPESNLDNQPLAQLGFPLLPKQGSGVQAAMLSQWLQNCDEHHGCVPLDIIQGHNPLPTRVLHIGSSAAPSLRLVNGGESCHGRYVALSHCWGKVDGNQMFCTYQENIDAFRESIDIDRLPATFRDAVNITRALGIEYLWIDSLCIIQNDEDDWEAESGRMEDVFSSAYCTLAASSTQSASAGFLQERKARACIKLDSPGRGALYVCKAIDNFHLDVEEGVLNRRGWVLQERALSRRSIHFTSTQVYWECGQGVHCETLAKLLNSKASFLGDSNFPNSALKFFKGGRILFFQSVYEMYSRLDFSYYKDRSVAISGLEKRLVRTFETRGGYGIFEAYLQRALLWERPEKGILDRIGYPRDRHVPSWSWMAYRGGIKYMNIPFEGADWTKDLKQPFHAKTNDWNKRHWQPDDTTKSTDLEATARKLNITRMEMRTPRFVFDESTDYDPAMLRCVVVGKAKKGEVSGEGPVHWALIIRPIKGMLYERVGVGYLLPSYVGEEDGNIRVR
ncbi:HET-domain-containing protein [Thozetella sp. PMI_491]|nr:HET-domain-containing protein [Thozetella sp. PMI_491]